MGIYGAYLFIVLALGALVRAFPAMVVKPYFGDSFYHFYLISEINRNDGRAPLKTSKYIFEDELHYPWGFHKFLSLFDLKRLRQFPFLPSLFADLAQAIVVFVLSCLLLRTSGASYELIFLCSSFACLFLFINPVLLGYGGGPRSYDLTPRASAESLVSISMSLIAYYYSNYSPWIFIVACCVGAFALLISRFALQAMLLMSLYLGLYWQYSLFLACLFCALCLAILLTKGRYLSILRGHFYYIRTYIKYLQHEHPAMALRRTFLRDLLAGLRDRGLKGLAHCYFNAPLLIFLSRNYLNLLVLWLFYFYAFDDSILFFKIIFAVSLSSYLSFLTILVPQLRFLGEAERYAEYGVIGVSFLVPPLLLHFAVDIYAFSLIYVALAFPSILLSWVQLFRLKSMNRQRHLDAVTLIEYLNGRKEIGRVVPIPEKIAPFIALNTPHMVFACMDFKNWYFNWKEFFHKYPWPNTDLKGWREKHAASLIVLDRSEYNGYGRLFYDFSVCDRVFHTKSYEVYEFR